MPPIVNSSGPVDPAISPYSHQAPCTYTCAVKVDATHVPIQIWRAEASFMRRHIGPPIVVIE